VITEARTCNDLTEVVHCGALVYVYRLKASTAVKQIYIRWSCVKSYATL